MSDPSNPAQKPMQELASLRARIAELEKETAQNRQIAEHLRESEERFRSVFDNSLDAILLTMPTGEILSANRAAQVLLGMTEKEIRREGRPGMVVEDEALAAALEARERSGQWRGMLTYRRKDGSTFPVEVRSNVFGGADGRAMTTLIFRDMTERKRAEDELRVYGEILSRMAEGVNLVRANDGVIVYTNPRFDEMFGYETGELLGRHASVLNAPKENSPEEVARGILDALEKTGRWSGEVCNVRKDGTLFWCHVRISSFHHFVHGPVWITSQVDITERKRLEEERILSEKKYRDIFENVPVGLYQVSPEGRFIRANDHAARILGYDSPEDLMDSITDIATQIYLDPSKRNEAVRLLEENGRLDNFEVECRHKNGSTVWVSFNAKVVRDGQGNILYHEGVSQDVTYRKKAERDLQESEERFRLFMDNSPTVAWIKDEQGRYVYLSRNLEKRFAMSGGWMGKTDEELWPAAMSDVYRHNDRVALETGGAVEIMEETINPDGSRSNWLTSKFPFRAYGKSYVAGIAVDLTEQKKAEDELARYRERLEALVKERTRELEDKTQVLEELNAATKVLLRHREEDRKELEERFVTNMKNLILPYAEKLKNTRLDERQMSYLSIMETHLGEVLSPLVRTMQHLNLTPAESRIASLIKDGRTTKEIAAILEVATSSIDTHRKSIRKKLGLNNAKVNLQSHLRSMEI